MKTFLTQVAIFLVTCLIGGCIGALLGGTIGFIAGCVIVGFLWAAILNPEETLKALFFLSLT